MRAKLAIAALFAALVVAGPSPRRPTPTASRWKDPANGYVRMDTRPARCRSARRSAGELVCRLAADERTAFQDEIERLQDESRHSKRACDVSAEDRVASSRIR